MSQNFSDRDPYRPTGRKHYNACDAHKTWNFLHHKSGAKDAVVSFEDTPNLEACRFGKGFQRRSLDQIWPNKEEKRVRAWENAIARIKAHQTQRKEFLCSKRNINGNIVTAPASIPAHHERELFQTKRKVSFTDPVSIRDKLIRSKVSKNRFYDPTLSKRPRIKQITPNQNHFSSDIQIGKNDIRSSGTADNFQGHGYE